jgi:hypothetical protein
MSGGTQVVVGKHREVVKETQIKTECEEQVDF